MPTIDEIQQQQRIKSMISESVNVQRYWSHTDATEEPTENLRRYRQISPFGQGTQSQSGLPKVVQDKMQQVGLWLYQSNPIAHRYIDQTADFVVGDGLTVESDNKDIQKYLRAFWHHPRNKMDQRIPEMVRELGIYGEILQGVTFLPNGLMQLSYISPSWIESVMQDPEDLSHFLSVKLNTASRGVIQEGSPDMTLLNIDEAGLRTGEAIFLAINRVADSTRGTSDLLPLMDVLANLDTFMFNTIEKARAKSEWFWDITYEGGNREQLTEYVRQALTEKSYPGAVHVHNEKIKWEAKSADIKSAEAENLYESIFSLVVTGLGIPPHWTGVGGGVVRAGAEASQEPSYKRLVTRQREIKSFLEDICNYQIDHLIASGRLPRGVHHRDITIQMPRISLRDTQRWGGAASRIVSALLDSVKEGVYSKEEAKVTLDHIFKDVERMV